MVDFSKIERKNSNEILEACFNNANKMPRLNTLEDWLHAFITTLAAECWSKKLDKKVQDEDLERKMKKVDEGCTCFAHAIEVSTRARIIRERRFYNYLKDVVECNDTSKLAFLSVKHKSLMLTYGEYKDLGLDKRREVTKKDADAIYLWKCAKDGQYEKEKVAKRVAVLKDLGFLF